MNAFVKFILPVVVITAIYCCNNQNNNNYNEPGEPEIKFDTVFYDFGDVFQGDKLEYTYYFKNTGTGNLIINDVVPSCGCTVPKYDKKPILPGKKGKLKILFDTKGRAGSVYKSVKVKSNAVNNSLTLTFKANILVNNNN